MKNCKSRAQTNKKCMTQPATETEEKFHKLLAEAEEMIMKFTEQLASATENINRHSSPSKCNSKCMSSISNQTEPELRNPSRSHLGSGTVQVVDEVLEVTKELQLTSETKSAEKVFCESTTNTIESHKPSKTKSTSCDLEPQKQVLTQSTQSKNDRIDNDNNSKQTDNSQDGNDTSKVPENGMLPEKYEVPLPTLPILGILQSCDCMPRNECFNIPENVPRELPEGPVLSCDCFQNEIVKPSIIVPSQNNSDESNSSSSEDCDCDVETELSTSSILSQPSCNCCDCSSSLRNLVIRQTSDAPNDFIQEKENIMPSISNSNSLNALNTTVTLLSKAGTPEDSIPNLLRDELDSQVDFGKKGDVIDQSRQAKKSTNSSNRVAPNKQRSSLKSNGVAIQSGVKTNKTKVNGKLPEESVSKSTARRDSSTNKAAPNKRRSLPKSYCIPAQSNSKKNKNKVNDTLLEKCDCEPAAKRDSSSNIAGSNKRRSSSKSYGVNEQSDVKTHEKKVDDTYLEECDCEPAFEPECACEPECDCEPAFEQECDCEPAFEPECDCEPAIEPECDCEPERESSSNNVAPNQRRSSLKSHGVNDQSGVKPNEKIDGTLPEKRFEPIARRDSSSIKEALNKRLSSSISYSVNEQSGVTTNENKVVDTLPEECDCNECDSAVISESSCICAKPCNLVEDPPPPAKENAKLNKLCIQNMEPVNIPAGLVIKIFPSITISACDSQPDFEVHTKPNVGYSVMKHPESQDKFSNDENGVSVTIEPFLKIKNSKKTHSTEQNCIQTESSKDAGTSNLPVCNPRSPNASLSKEKNITPKRNNDTCKSVVTNNESSDLINSVSYTSLSSETPSLSELSASLPPYSPNMDKVRKQTYLKMLSDPETHLIYKSYQVYDGKKEESYELVDVSHIDEDVYKTFVNPKGKTKENELSDSGSSNRRKSMSSNSSYLEQITIQTDSDSGNSQYNSRNNGSKNVPTDQDLKSQNGDVPDKYAEYANLETKFKILRQKLCQKSERLQNAQESNSLILSSYDPQNSRADYFSNAESRDDASMFSNTTETLILEINKKLLNKSQKKNLSRLGVQRTSNDNDEYVEIHDVSVQTSLEYLPDVLSSDKLSDSSSDDESIDKSSISSKDANLEVPSRKNSREPYASTKCVINDKTKQFNESVHRNRNDSNRLADRNDNKSLDPKYNGSKDTERPNENKDKVATHQTDEEFFANKIPVQNASGDTSADGSISKFLGFKTRTYNRPKQRRPSNTTSENTSESDYVYSEGERSCNCSVSIGEIHTGSQCSTRKALSHFNQKQKSIYEEFQKAHLKVSGKKVYNSNWIAYYVSRSPNLELSSPGENSHSAGIVKK